MAQRHYIQCRPSSAPGQSDEDDARRTLTAYEQNKLCNGRFKIYWIADLDSDAIVSEGRIFSVGQLGGEEFGLRFYVGDGLTVALVGTGTAEAVIEFDAYTEITFELHAELGTLTVSGAASGDGVYSGDAWNDTVGADAVLRIGGDVTADGKSANGWVSLPYALPWTAAGGFGGFGTSFQDTSLHEEGELTGFGII